MNEQQLADLFTFQLDRLLAGHPLEEAPVVDDLSGLLELGQSLSQLRFEPDPVARAAFETRIESWFGPANGSVTPAGSSRINGSGPGFNVLLVAVGLGLGLAVLLGPLWLGEPVEPVPTLSISPTAHPVEELPPETATPPPSPVKPTTTPAPVIASPTLPREVTPTLRSSLGETLPALPAPPSPSPTPSPTLPPATAPIPTGSAEPGGNEGGESTLPPGNAPAPANPPPEANPGGPPSGDHDRGHGNDADGVDEDNPGNSSGQQGGGGNNNGGNNGGSKGGGRGK